MSSATMNSTLRRSAAEARRAEAISGRPAAMNCRRFKRETPRLSISHNHRTSAIVQPASMSLMFARFAIAALLALVCAAEPKVARVIDISPVWAGHPVGFALLTHNDRQYIAFYDAERRMTVAARTLDSDRWDT